MKASRKFKTAGQPDDLIQHCISTQHSLSNLAIAGNDKVACNYSFKGDTSVPNNFQHEELDLINPDPHSLKQYNSFSSYLNNDGEELELDGRQQMVVANQCVFTVLSRAGEVRTWGDGRYEACFGREISAAK